MQCATQDDPHCLVEPDNLRAVTILCIIRYARTLWEHRYYCSITPFNIRC